MTVWPMRFPDQKIDGIRAAQQDADLRAKRIGAPIDANTAGLSRRDHPDTAHEAAQKASSTGKVRRAVYDYIAAQGDVGATDEQIIDAISGHSANGIRPRRVELVGSGHIVDSETRRRTRSGRSAIVWRAR